MRTVPVLLLALAVLAGCSDSGSRQSAEPTASPSGLTNPFPTAEVRGRLVRAGGPAGTPDGPVRGEVLFRGPDGSVARTQVDSGGEFRIQLAPGDYRLEGHSPDVGEGRTLCVTDPAITTLVEDGTVTADI